MSEGIASVGSTIEGHGKTQLEKQGKTERKTEHVVRTLSGILKIDRDLDFPVFKLKIKTESLRHY